MCCFVFHRHVALVSVSVYHSSRKVDFLSLPSHCKDESKLMFVFTLEIIPPVVYSLILFFSSSFFPPPLGHMLMNVGRIHSS